MSENLSLPRILNSQTISNSSGKSLTLDISEDATQSYELYFPPSNDMGYLYNDSTGLLSWNGVNTDSPFSNYLTIESVNENDYKEIQVIDSDSHGDIAASNDGNYLVIGIVNSETRGGFKYYKKIDGTYVLQSTIYPNPDITKITTVGGGDLGSSIAGNSDLSKIVLNYINARVLVVYYREGDTWNEVEVISISSPEITSFNSLPIDIAVYGELEYIVISSPLTRVNSVTNSGVIIIYKKNDNEEKWEESQLIAPSTPNLFLGNSVDLSETYLLISSYFSSEDVLIYSKDDQDQWILTYTISTPLNSVSHTSISPDGTYFMCSDIISDYDEIKEPGRVLIYSYDSQDDTWNLDRTIESTVERAKLGKTIFFTSENDAYVLSLDKKLRLYRKIQESWILYYTITYSMGLIVDNPIGSCVPIVLSEEGNTLFLYDDCIGFNFSVFVYDFTISDKLTLTGVNTASFDDGVPSVPSINFSNQITTGIFRDTTDGLGFTVEGSPLLYISSQGINTLGDVFINDVRVLTDQQSSISDSIVALTEITDNSTGTPSDAVNQLNNIQLITDNTGGTPSTSIVDVGVLVTGVDGTGNNAASKTDVDSRLTSINDNLSSLSTELITQRSYNTTNTNALSSLANKINECRDDLNNLSNTINEVLAALRSHGLISS
jgi:hypothetical protein